VFANTHNVAALHMLLDNVISNVVELHAWVCVLAQLVVHVRHGVSSARVWRLRRLTAWSGLRHQQPV
jgi:hypothetical protein